jgi:hypothetical protein
VTAEKIIKSQIVENRVNRGTKSRSVLANADPFPLLFLTGRHIERARQLSMKAWRRTINPLIDRPHRLKVERLPNAKRISSDSRFMRDQAYRTFSSYLTLERKRAPRNECANYTRMGTFDREPTGECMYNCSVVRHFVVPRSRKKHTVNATSSPINASAFQSVSERRSIAILRAGIYIYICMLFLHVRREFRASLKDERKIRSLGKSRIAIKTIKRYTRAFLASRGWSTHTSA